MVKYPGKNKWAVATVSLGKHPSHTLERKLQAAARNGFHGVELVHSDLLNHAKSNRLTPLQSAQKIRSVCRELGIEVLSLSPLKNFEGNLHVSLSERLGTAKEWIELAVAAGTGIIQMPSQFLPQSTGDYPIIIPELQALADLAQESHVSIAYEAVAFAKSNSLWQDSLRIVEAVDRPNFGLCLDSYHIQSLIWGDPRIESGQIAGGDKALYESMKEFVQRCPRSRVLYVQLSDASKLDPPLTEDSPMFDGLEVKDARLAWSRAARPFPLEALGYFPVLDIAKTWLVDFAWDGWVSLEGFLQETEIEENGPEEMAMRARCSVFKLLSQIS